MADATAACDCMEGRVGQESAEELVGKTTSCRPGRCWAGVLVLRRVLVVLQLLRPTGQAVGQQGALGVGKRETAWGGAV